MGSERDGNIGPDRTPQNRGRVNSKREDFASAVQVLGRERAYPVDVPFSDAVRVISRRGSGAKGLVAAMNQPSGYVEPAGDR